MRAAARRIVVLVGGAIIVTCGVSLVVGLALGSSGSRSMATGLYLVGCFLVVLGVLAGMRGPLRPAESKDEADPIGSLLGVGVFSKGARPATGDERADARATSWLFLTVGITMILVGIVLDPRMRVF